MEHLVALSQELLSTPGKASKQQVRPRGPAPGPSHPSAQTKQVSPGSGEPLPSPSHGNGIHLRADRAPGFPSSRPRLRYPRVSGRMEGAEEQALPRGPAFPSKAHPSALHPIAQSCTGGLRGPGVLLPAGDAEESRSPEQPEQPRAWPALSRCGSIPRPRSPEHMLLGLLGLQLGPGSELAGSPGSNKPLCLSVASLIPRWHCPVVLSSAPCSRQRGVGTGGAGDAGHAEGPAESRAGGRKTQARSGLAVGPGGGDAATMEQESEPTGLEPCQEGEAQRLTREPMFLDVTLQDNVIFRDGWAQGAAGGLGVERRKRKSLHSTWGISFPVS